MEVVHALFPQPLIEPLGSTLLHVSLAGRSCRFGCAARGATVEATFRDYPLCVRLGRLQERQRPMQGGPRGKFLRVRLTSGRKSITGGTFRPLE